MEERGAIIHASESLPESRERLARALSRFDRIARSAAEAVAGLRHEKLGMEKRLAEMAKLGEQERSNFAQQSALLSSAKAESEERAKTAEDLGCRLDDQERLMNEQLQNIARLEADLEMNVRLLKERIELEESWRNELAEWQEKVTKLEDRIVVVQNERDSYKTQLIDREREDAQFALRLTPEDRDTAAKTIDSLLDHLTTIGSRLAAEEAK